MDEVGERVNAIERLAEAVSAVLSAETAYLARYDLIEAGQLLHRKRDATAELHRGLCNNPLPADLSREDRLRLERAFCRLRTLADDNGIALERALAAQMQVIETIARAVPDARATQAPIYQPDGSKTPPRPPQAYAFASRM